MTDENSSTSKTVLLSPEEQNNRIITVASGEGPSEQYAICGKVGDGGMGIVYLARDQRLGRFVAIKRLNEAALANPTLRQRFLHEARAVAALNHAHVVHIYELGEDKLGPYIVMEYVSGPPQTEIYHPQDETTSSESRLPPAGMTLERYINRNGPMTTTEAVTMLLKLARTMAYSHSCGVIHRDLKPANVLLDLSYEPKIVDFGLARLIKTETIAEDEAALTVPGERLLSLGYSAPELEEDASVSDERADIYSLGAILYFLLVGRNPRFYREQDVPLYLREVMRRSLENVREQRFRSAGDFIRALSEAESRGQVVAPTIKTTWRCKWCDAVNPISTKFCAECGWDGSERCLECSAEIFVGQQYCSACGADCRVYEQTANIIEQIQRAWGDHRYDRIATLAGRLQGFEPSGTQGRNWLLKVKDLVAQAEKMLARRSRLASLIPNELKAENYERAKTFIEEFRAVNEDPHVYQDELKDIPNMIQMRDIVRIRQAIRTHDWLTASGLASALSAKYHTSPEYQDIASLLLRHKKQKEILRWGIGISISIFLYLLTVPFAGRLSGGTFNSFWRFIYTPASWVYRANATSGLFGAYQSFIDQEGSIHQYFTQDEDITSKTEVVITTPLHLPKEVLEKKRIFESQIMEVDAAKRALSATVRVQYRKALTDLLDRRRKIGDYEGVVAINAELDNFKEKAEVGDVQKEDTPELIVLKNSFSQMDNEHTRQFARQVLDAIEFYLNALEAFRKGYTQTGDMEKASLITKEIDRIKTLPYIKEANNLVGPSEDEQKKTQIIPLIQSERMAEIRQTRDILESKIKNLKQTFEASSDDFPQNYLLELRQRMELYRKDNNLNAWDATSRELRRFEQQPQLSTDDLVLEPDDLRNLQAFFLKQLDRKKQEYASAVLAHIKDYITELEAWKRSYTVKDQLDMAAAVNVELQRIRKTPDYLEAFNLFNTGASSRIPDITTPPPETQIIRPIAKPTIIQEPRTNHSIMLKQESSL